MTAVNDVRVDVGVPTLAQNRSVTIVIPGPPPPSLNAQERMHWSDRAVLRRTHAAFAFLHWYQEMGKPYFERPQVTFRLYFRDRRTRDPDNFTGAVKGYLDGLKGRAFPDDNAGVIDLRPVELYVDRQRPRVEIVLAAQPAAPEGTEA